MSEPDPLQDRVLQLEQLFTHQEHLLQQLNNEVLQLRAENDQLKIQLLRKIQRLQQEVENRSATFDPDERPPHY